MTTTIEAPIKDVPIIEKLLKDNYTTQQVAFAVGRRPIHWSRIRHRFIAKYNLRVIKIGRSYYYKKEDVDRMVEDLLKNGD